MPEAVFAQAGGPIALDTVFFRMYKYFDSAESSQSIDKKQLSDVRRLVRSIREITMRFEPVQIRQDYVESLDFNAKLMESTLNNTDKNDNVESLNVVAKDLQLKILFEAAAAGAGAVFRGRVEVAVHTERNGQAVPGLRIVANPLRWANANPMAPLGVSSPANGSLPPGIYQFSASNAADQVVARQTVSVGLNGNDSESVVFILP
ncbi:hypothetical protein [Bosea sp. PAMC 26642]|uniref:hypothetical protein n=1 Tax=Bosea sp. (strain PAMC 26642) TaxID=1792307 RepID=UPI0012E88CC6|nr:hypothetical protein [Bosea sp. PAMC 26642]